MEKNLKRNLPGGKQIICAATHFCEYILRVFCIIYLYFQHFKKTFLFLRRFLVAGWLHVFEWCIITSTFCIKSYFQIISAHMSVIRFVTLHLVTCAIVSRLGCKLVLIYEVSRDWLITVEASLFISVMKPYLLPLHNPPGVLQEGKGNHSACCSLVLSPSINKHCKSLHEEVEFGCRGKET